MIEILEKYLGESFLDEDGNQLSIEKSQAISISDLQKFEMRHNVTLPQDLRELILWSSGIKIFGAEIQALDEMEFYEDHRLMTFHSWGNGDVDCISVDQGSHYGTVYFVNHSAANSVSMNIAFGEWIFLAIDEIRHKGAILHPMDYLFRNEEGMYKEVFLKLKMQ